MLPGAGLTIDAGAVAGAVVVPVATPVPVRATVPLAPVDALLVYSRFPVAAPAALGANARLKLTALPGATAIGSDPSPVIENGCPLTDTAEISTDAVPPLVSVTEAVPVLPIVTLPKATEVDETTSVPVLDAAAAGVATIEPQPDSASGRQTPAAARSAAPQRSPPPGLCERRDRSKRLLLEEKKEKEEWPSGPKGGVNRTACIYLTSYKAFSDDQQRNLRQRFLAGMSDNPTFPDRDLP